MPMNVDEKSDLVVAGDHRLCMLDVRLVFRKCTHCFRYVKRGFGYVAVCIILYTSKVVADGCGTHPTKQLTKITSNF